VTRHLTYTCNECGRPKGDSNHWFVVEIGPQGMLVRPFGDPNAALWPGSNLMHLCGETCTLTVVSRMIEVTKGVAEHDRGNGFKAA
jgi:hypothetical protein